MVAKSFCSEAVQLTAGTHAAERKHQKAKCLLRQLSCCFSSGNQSKPFPFVYVCLPWNNGGAKLLKESQIMLYPNSNHKKEMTANALHSKWVYISSCQVIIWFICFWLNALCEPSCCGLQAPQTLFFNSLFVLCWLQLPENSSVASQPFSGWKIYQNCTLTLQVCLTYLNQQWKNSCPLQKGKNLKDWLHPCMEIRNLRYLLGFNTQHLLSSHSNELQILLILCPFLGPEFLLLGKAVVKWVMTDFMTFFFLPWLSSEST